MHLEETLPANQFRYKLIRITPKGFSIRPGANPINIIKKFFPQDCRIVQEATTQGSGFRSFVVESSQFEPCTTWDEVEVFLLDEDENGHVFPQSNIDSATVEDLLRSIPKNKLHELSVVLMQELLEESPCRISSEVLEVKQIWFLSGSRSDAPLKASKAQITGPQSDFRSHRHQLASFALLSTDPYHSAKWVGKWAYTDLSFDEVALKKRILKFINNPSGN